MKGWIYSDFSSFGKEHGGPERCMKIVENFDKEKIHLPWKKMTRVFAFLTAFSFIQSYRASKRAKQAELLLEEHERQDLLQNSKEDRTKDEKGEM